MKLSTTALALIATFASLACSTPNRLRCIDSLDAATPCTSTMTVTKTSIVTPAASTSIRTVQFTCTSTGSTVTNTVTHTTAVGTNSTTTITSTVVESTTASGVFTLTVPMPADFTPIRRSFPGSTYDGAFGNSPVDKRDGRVRDVDGSQSPVEKRGALEVETNRHLASHRRAEAVCLQPQISSTCTIKETTHTVKKTKSASTVTSTVTSTTTTMSHPTASTTITIISTITTTSIATASSTATSTSTKVIFTSTTTVYAACATTNMADRAGNQALENARPITGEPGEQTMLTTTGAYDCCVAAFTNLNGSTTIWGFRAGGTCLIAYVASKQAQGDNAYDATLGNTTTASIVLGNGPSGLVFYD